MLLANEGDIKYATRERTPTNIDNMIYYSEDYDAEYIIDHDGESVISFPDVPVGAEVIRVDLETKTLSHKTSWMWNPTSRVLTLTNGPVIGPYDPTDTFPTTKGMLVAIIYKIKKTTL